MRTTARQSRKLAGQTQHARNDKARFLPMPRAMADELVLPVRLAPELIRKGHPDRTSACGMANALLMVGFLAESGHARLDSDFLGRIEQCLLDAFDFDAGAEKVGFDAELIEALTKIVNEYDRLMCKTRLQAIVEANEKFQRLGRSAISAAG